MAAEHEAGARESHAGNEFHVLWAARRSLALLSPHGDLRRLVLEGVSPDDRLGGVESSLHGVDLTEYLGGENFAEATTVVIAQLKHSERRPNEAWSPARLAHMSSRGKPVVRRLGEAFSAFAQEHGREAVLAKLRVRLISNQPAGKDLSRLLEEARRILGPKPRGNDYSRLHRGLGTRGAAQLEQMLEASGLGRRHFVDLLRVLEFDLLGSGGRWRQETQIVESLGESLLDHVATGVAQLTRMVRREMGPDGRNSTGLSRTDVLANLEVARWDDLFPLPPRFALPQKVIATSDARRLGRAVRDGDGATLIAHGDAGVGKTTTIASLEGLLPEGSVLLAFDCFADGEYLSGEETRHQSRPMIMQLINELALRCGTPMLLHTPEFEQQLWRRFGEVLTEAGSALAREGARLVVAIDAIDNAVIAGRVKSERTFVGDLLRTRIPAGVTLVVTCRSHRRGELGDLQGARQVELSGFDLDASIENLRRRFPTAEEETCRRFHSESLGNPRSQFYALDPARPGAPESAQEAAAQVHSTEHIFEDLVRAAILEVADRTQARRRLAELVCLSRPAGIEELAAVAGVEREEVERFCRGLVPGVEIGEGLVGFRDEDFETHLRSLLSESETREAHSRLADHYLHRRHEDAGAAGAVAPHLRQAGRDLELLDLALEEKQPRVIPDPMVRLQVYTRRLELALQVAPWGGEEAVKLILLAARASRSDEAIIEVVRARPDLAMRYGDPEAVARTYREAAQEPWLGPMHLRVAAMEARRGRLADAAEHMRMAESWIRRWAALDPDERAGWDVKIADIAAGTLAAYHLKGAGAARRWIGRWRPAGVVIKAGGLAAIDLAREGSPRRAFRALAEVEIGAAERAEILAALFEAGHPASKREVQAAARALVKEPPRERDGEWVIDFCELVAFRGGDRALLEGLLGLLECPTPSLPPYGSGRVGDWDPPLRMHCLRRAAEGRDPDLEELVPKRLREDAEEPKEYRAAEERRELRRRYETLSKRYLRVYFVRASVLVGGRRATAVMAELEPELEAMGSAPAHQRRDDDVRTYGNWARIAVGALAMSRGDASAALRQIAETAGELSAHAAFTVPIEIAETVIDQGRHREAAIGLLDEVARLTARSEEPAGERSARLLRIAAALDRHRPGLAAEYYGQAVEAAKGLDVMGAGVLNVHIELGRSIGPEEGRPDLAERVARALERYVPFVEDSDYLPWRRTVEAVSTLHPPAGLALCTRWESEARLGLGQSLPAALSACQETDFLSPETVLVLLEICDERSFRADLACKSLELLRSGGAPTRPRLGAAIRRLSHYVCRDLLPETRFAAARVIFGWLGEHDLADLPGGPELAELSGFAEGLEEQGHGGRRAGFDGGERDEEIERLLAGAGRDEPEGLAGRLGELRRAFAGDKEIATYLERFGAGTAPECRVEALRALAAIGAEEGVWHFAPDGPLAGLAGWLSRWRGSAVVRRWEGEELEALVEAQLPNLIRYPEVARRALPIVFGPLGLRDPATLLTRAVGPLLAELGAPELYSLAGALSSQLPVPGQAGVLEWSLRRLEADEEIVGPALPNGRDASVARLLWTLFGHPDKRQRWRAAHGARGLLGGGDADLAHELVELLDERSGGAFLGADQESLWMSAQQWTLMVLARIAAEEPGSLTAEEKRLAEIALDDRWPHAAIREFARRAALRLGDRSDSAISVRTRERLEGSNRPHGELPRPERPRQLNERSDQGEGARFRFDAMDTLPYWFGHLGRVFGCDSSEIATAAESWIVDRLFLTEGDVKAVREQNPGQYEYDLTSNRHGSLPRVERYRTYLEYHAMLLSAGQFIAEGREVAADWWGEPEDPWAAWLKDHLDAEPESWSIDRRRPVPLRRENFGELGPIEDWRQVGAEQYEAALERSDTLVVEARIEVSRRERYGTTSVSSALVSPETASALQAALESCANPFNFRLPEESPSEAGEAEIEEPGFELRGWLAAERREEAGLEAHDPLRRIDLSFSRPGEDFISRRGLERFRGGREFRDSQGAVVGDFSAWSDLPPSERVSTRASYGTGEKLRVDTASLLAYLRERRLDLIIEVRIQRQFAESYDHEKEETYDQGRCRLFVLRGDGSFETMA